MMLQIDIRMALHGRAIALFYFILFYFFAPFSGYLRYFRKVLLSGIVSLKIFSTKLLTLLIYLYLIEISGKDNFAPCAASIHVKCATQGQQDMKNGVKMCSSIKNFIQCYENPEYPCTAQIYTDYVNLLNTFTSRVIEMYQENPGVMPDC